MNHLKSRRNRSAVFRLALVSTLSIGALLGIGSGASQAASPSTTYQGRASYPGWQSCNLDITFFQLSQSQDRTREELDAYLSFSHCTGYDGAAKAAPSCANLPRSCHWRVKRVGDTLIWAGGDHKFDGLNITRTGRPLGHISRNASGVKMIELSPQFQNDQGTLNRQLYSQLTP